MKKKEILGILTIVLTVIACYIAYYKFWAALVGFAISAVVLPVVFYFVRSKFVWLSILLAVVLDLVLYWPEYSYYESRGPFIFVTLLQVVVMAIIILVLKLIGAKAKK